MSSLYIISLSFSYKLKCWLLFWFPTYFQATCYLSSKSPNDYERTLQEEEINEPRITHKVLWSRWAETLTKYPPSHKTILLWLCTHSQDWGPIYLLYIHPYVCTFSSLKSFLYTQDSRLSCSLSPGCIVYKLCGVHWHSLRVFDFWYLFWALKS